MSIALRVRAFLEFAVVATIRASQLPADVVFATSTPLTIGIPGIVAAKVRRAPMVFEVRDLWPEVPVAMGMLKNPLARGLAKSLQKACYRSSTSIIALSPDMKAGIVRKGVSPERIAVIPNASDTDVFAIDEHFGREFRAQYSWLQDRPLVVYAGTFGRVNGVGYLVDLARAIGQIREDVRFLLIGGGVELERVRNHARVLGVLDKSVFLMAQVEKKTVAKALSAATICCSTVIDNEALWANSANKIFDALAAGRPVFINHQGWQKDVLEESGAGVALNATDTVLAAQSLARLLEDSSKLQRMRRAASALAMDRFNRDVLFSQFRTVLEQARQS